ncbi:hypothetical protein PV325_002037 [Microctonus aethiopoides]|nr:hypothetical protein PV325_002037 [Microctonus aethiopoides]
MMQKGLTCFDKTSYESTSSDDDFNSVLSNIDLLNPQVYPRQSQYRFRRNRSRRKLLKSKLPDDNSIALHHNSSILEQKNVENKNEVILAEAEYSSDESIGQRIIRSKRKLRERISTPRVVQAIKNNSGTLKHEETLSSPLCSKESRNKSRNVVLRQLDHQSSAAESSKNSIRLSKSEQAIGITSLPLNQTSTPQPLKYQRQFNHRSTKKYKALNVEIIQESQKHQTCKSDIDNITTKLMAQSPQALTKIHMNQIDSETNRVFPFQSTPSGNLKIIPNQVVFESKKVSVLVADPKHTKVNVKAELNKSDMEYDTLNFGEEYSNIKQTPGELPPGVTSSTIDQLQAQQKLPQIGTSYVPRTQPHRIKHHHREMEQPSSNQQSTPYRLSSAHEVPLSSLGFNTDEPIDWENVNLPEKTDLYFELSRRITNYTNADFIVRIGNDEFHCHLLVLQSYSTFFDEKHCKEIDLTESNVTSKAFSIIYDWMISTTSESCHLLRRDNILDIFMGAQYLGIKELEEQCWAFIDNDELFSEDTAFLLYLEAKKIGNTAVMELMVPRIMKFFLLLVSTKDFLELSVEELCSLLRSNYICVNSEMEVLMSAVRWLMFNWDERKQYMIQVLKCIRFGLIAPWQLIDVKRNPENPEFMELMSFEEIRKMVDDGLAFVIIKYWYGDQTEDYYHWIDLLGLTEPTNRNWAGEDKNYVTYREFLLYLDEYQRTIMPELKLRRGKSMSSNHQQCSELPQSNRTHGNCTNHSAVETASLGQVGAFTNNTMRISSKYPKSTLQSSAPTPPQLSTTPGVPNHTTQSPSMGMGMSPEFFTKYLTSLGSNSRPNACGNEMDNDKVKIGNAAMCHSTWQNHNRDISQENYFNNTNERTAIVNNIQLEPNIIIEREKYLNKKHLISGRIGDHSDSSISEDDAAMKIQATYRGYKTRREINKFKKNLSNENKCTKKVAELLSNSTVNIKFPKSLEPTRAASINTGSYRYSFKNTEKTYRPGSSQKRQFKLPMNKNNLNECQNFDVEKFHQTCTQKDLKQCDVSLEKKNASINYLEQNKSVKANKSTTLLYNCNERMSSVTPSENNTDTEEPLSPVVQQNTLNKYKNLYRPKFDSVNQINNIDSLEKSENYFPDHSLFYPDCESVLVLGGIDLHLDCGASVNSGKDMYRYNPMENVWEFVGEIPKPRHHHSTIYFNGRVYLAGGADPLEYEVNKKNVVVGTVWSYDPTRRQWFNEPEMLTPRQNFGLVVSHGKIFAIGGEDKNGIALKSVEALDPLVGKWKKMQPMNLPRVGAACANFHDFIWVAGGMTKYNILKEVECYDPVKNTWHKIEPLRIPRCLASLHVNNDSLYLIGGAERMSSCDTMTESIKTIDVWDTNLRTWSQLTEMSIARHSHSIGFIGNQLLIIGGITTVYMKTLKCIERYCCKRTKWIEGVASLPYAVSGHDSVSLPPLNIKHF